MEKRRVGVEREIIRVFLNLLFFLKRKTRPSRIDIKILFL